MSAGIRSRENSRTLLSKVTSRHRATVGQNDATSPHPGQPNSDSGASQAEPGLGPYAHEKKMPRWLVRVLRNGDKTATRTVLDYNGNPISVDLKVVETPTLVPALARLSQADASIKWAYYCSPLVHHVAKLRREGSFCGYRNIQMLISYICNAGAPGSHSFQQQPLPSIFRLQEMIEQAWDQGFNTASRDEVGALQMTRKFIGTSEVEALLLSQGTGVVTRAFVASRDRTALELLLDYVAEYFEVTGPSSATEKVFVSQKPPLFFQRSGHSMTIVGIDEDVRGSRTLIIFDPRYKPSKALQKMALGRKKLINVNKVLKAHRYGASSLAQYEAFELVQLTGKPCNPNPAAS